jgi:hypothetical protein
MHFENPFWEGLFSPEGLARQSLRLLAAAEESRDLEARVDADTVLWCRPHSVRVLLAYIPKGYLSVERGMNAAYKVTKPRNS